MSTAVAPAQQPLFVHAQPPPAKLKRLKPTEERMTIMAPRGYEVEISYVLITPELAEALKAQNTRNRRPSDATTQPYARDMTEDNWWLTGETLKIAESGLILDGQHRIFAIIESGIAQWMLVVGGLPESVQKYVDIGRARSSADQLKMDGIQNSPNLSATAKLLIQWKAWREGVATYTPGKAQVTTYVHAHIDALKRGWSYANDLFANVNKGVSKAALAAAFVRGGEVMGDPYGVANFMERVGSGENLEKGDPLFALNRTYMFSGEADRMVDLHKFVKCWNAHMMGQALNSYQAPQGGLSTRHLRQDMFGPCGSNVVVQDNVVEANA